MPRRGEYGRISQAEPVPSDPTRIGARQVTCGIELNRRDVTIELDPAEFRCSTLVAELADEWVEHMAALKVRNSVVYRYRAAVRRLAEYVDQHSTDPEAMSLAGETPELAFLIAEWMRRLPSAFKEGSAQPSGQARSIQILVQCRLAREGAVVNEEVARLVSGAHGVAHGRERELDEFSRAEKRALIRAAWADVRAVEARLARGHEMITAASDDPAGHDWLHPATLLRDLARGWASLAEIVSRLPRLEAWPPELRELAGIRGTQVRPSTCRYQLAVSLVSMLYPSNHDLHAFHLLLVAATGHAPDELCGLTEDDVEFTPSGVRLRMTKLRGRVVRTRAFSGEVAAFGDGGGVNAVEVMRRLLAATQRVREDSGLAPGPVFARATAASRPRLQVKFGVLYSTSQGQSFAAWVRARGLTISQPLDIRRIRKSVKVEKAIAMRGVVSDIADDHTVETFLGHYAHGTTLHVVSGQVVNRAQRSWLEAALSGVPGPLALDDEAVDALTGMGAGADSEAFRALGMTRDQAEQLREGALDMGVTSCRDPFSSPFSKQGDLCSVAPLRCLECSNAFILPSNLPQLLLFADHLEQLSHRLTPQHFQLLWGQSQTNLAAVLAERTAVEITAARRQIAEQDLRLRLPLSAHTDFDL